MVTPSVGLLMHCSHIPHKSPVYCTGILMTEVKIGFVRWFAGGPLGIPFGVGHLVGFVLVMTQHKC